MRVDGDRGVNESWPSSKKKALFFVRLLNKSLLQVPDDSSISAR
jgi:hypothetical protein